MGCEQSLWWEKTKKHRLFSFLQSKIIDLINFHFGNILDHSLTLLRDAEKNYQHFVFILHFAVFRYCASLSVSVILWLATHFPKWHKISFQKHLLSSVHCAKSEAQTLTLQFHPFIFGVLYKLTSTLQPNDEFRNYIFLQSRTRERNEKHFTFHSCLV